MYKLVIDGGTRLRGRVAVSGAKNAALPLLAASLLPEGVSLLRNVPAVADVATMQALLGDLGAEIVTSRGDTRVDASAVSSRPVAYERVAAMRASVLVLGPLLARHGRAEIPLPGGCCIGPRPIDQHLQGLTALGARFDLRRGVLRARAARLRGASVAFDVVTVTGTMNVMLAASLARGRTHIDNAACEPEIEDLARSLNKSGARIQGAGTPRVTIEGVRALHPLDHAVMPDRIEAATFILAAVLNRGDVELTGVAADHLEAVLTRARAAGAEITSEATGLRIRGPRELAPADTATRPYPGFPTDVHPMLAVAMTQARGQSMLTETVFETRFQHVAELCRLGADIVIEGRTAIVRGPTRLQGAKVVATDLRAAAALVLAGLIAEGTTEVLRASHLDRGYEGFEKKLRKLGARVRRVKIEATTGSKPQRTP